MVRMLLAALTAFVISVLVGWVLIPILRALHAGQSIKEIGPNWHKNKEGTPTMGGIMFIVAAIFAVLAFGWRDMAQGNWQAVFVLGFAIVVYLGVPMVCLAVFGVFLMLMDLYRNQDMKKLEKVWAGKGNAADKNEEEEFFDE